MDAAVKRIAPQTQCYQRRRPEKTLWYRTVQTHFETWLTLSTGQGDESPPPPMLSKPFAAISTAAFSLTASPAPIATSAGTTS